MKIFRRFPAGTVAGPSGEFAVDEGHSSTDQTEESVRSRPQAVLADWMNLNVVASLAAREPGKP
jgi:hypothetical protein